MKPTAPLPRKDGPLPNHPMITEFAPTPLSATLLIIICLRVIPNTIHLTNSV